MYFELTSDRDVQIDGIGLLSANEPMRITNEQEIIFETLHNVKLVKANFPYFVQVTACVNSSEEV